MQEIEWHLFALLFLLGSAYTFKHDGHVRVDILYKSRLLNDRHRAWLDLFGGLFLLTPISRCCTFQRSIHGTNRRSPIPSTPRREAGP